MSIVNSKLRNTKRSLNSIHNILKNKKLLNDELTSDYDVNVNVIELHLTDICDLKCGYCSYRSGNDVKRNTIPFFTLDKIINLKPKAIVLAGGGEPLLYESDTYDINSIIGKLVDNKISVGLITNGSKVVNIEILNNLSWLRVSLDAIGEDNFFALKKGKFSKRIKFLHNTIRSSCKHIGIGFLYNNNNLNEVLGVCEYIYTQFNDERINIQFRPTCKIQSCECPSENYSSDDILTSNREEWWTSIIEGLRFKLDSIKIINEELYNFILNQTNFLSILSPDFTERKAPFRSCYISLARWIIRADGDIYPCVMKATNSGKPLGNIIHDSPLQIKKGMKGYFELDHNYCNGPLDCCNFVGVTNELIEQNIKTHNDNENTITNDDYFF